MTQVENARRNLLLKQDRSKHHWTSNQESTTNILSMLRRRLTVRHALPDFREEDGAVEFKNSGANVCLTIRVFPALVDSNKAKIFAKRRRSQEENPVLPGSPLSRYFPLPLSNSSPFWRKTNRSSIARQRVVTKRLCRVHLPRWKFPRHAFHHPYQDWFLMEKMSKEGDRRYSSRPWTPCSRIYTSLGITTWQKPRVAVYKQKLQNIPEFSVLGQFQNCSEEGIDVLPNKIWQDHPSQHSPSSLYWKSGGNEFGRSAA